MRSKRLCVEERGQKWIKGIENRTYDVQWGIAQVRGPLLPRQRLQIWGDHKLRMKAGYCFFYIPTVIMFGIGIPAF